MSSYEDRDTLAKILGLTIGAVIPLWVVGIIGIIGIIALPILIIWWLIRAAWYLGIIKVLAISSFIAILVLLSVALGAHLISLLG